MTAYEDMGVTSHTQEEKNKNKFSTYGTSIRRNDEKHPFPSYFAIYIFDVFLHNTLYWRDVAKTYSRFSLVLWGIDEKLADFDRSMAPERYACSYYQK